MFFSSPVLAVTFDSEFVFIPENIFSLYLDLGESVQVAGEVHAVRQVLTHALSRAGAHQGLRLRQVQRRGLRQRVGQGQGTTSIQHHKLQHQTNHRWSSPVINSYMAPMTLSLKGEDHILVCLNNRYISEQQGDLTGLAISDNWKVGVTGQLG